MSAYGTAHYLSDKRGSLIMVVVLHQLSITLTGRNVVPHRNTAILIKRFVSARKNMIVNILVFLYYKIYILMSY